MRVIAIPKFKWGENTVEFWPTKGTPGFNYKVIINGLRMDWLSATHQPNARAAKYFILKHRETIRLQKI